MLIVLEKSASLKQNPPKKSKKEGRSFYSAPPDRLGGQPDSAGVA